MGPKFTLKKIPQEKSLAEILKKARQERGYSFSEIERKTKIRAKYLQALEEENYEKLPADVYVKGFLRNYCSLLGLNYSQISQIYKRERGIQKSINKAKEPQLPRYLKTPKVIITPKTLIIGAIALAFLIILGYIWYQFSSLAAPPRLTLSYPPDNLKIGEDTITIEGKASSGAEVYIDNQQIFNISPEGSFKITYSLQNGLNTIKITAKNKLGSLTTIQRQILAEFPTRVVSPQPTREVSPLKKLVLTLKIGPNPAWIHLEVDGGIAYEGIMSPQTVRSFEGKESFILTTGNSGSTQVIFNGKDLGKLGTEGEVKRGIRFDKTTKIE